MNDTALLIAGSMYTDAGPAMPCPVSGASNVLAAAVRAARAVPVQLEGKGHPGKATKATLRLFIAATEQKPLVSL